MVPPKSCAPMSEHLLWSAATMPLAALTSRGRPRQSYIASMLLLRMLPAAEAGRRGIGPRQQGNQHQQQCTKVNRAIWLRTNVPTHPATPRWPGVLPPFF